MPFKCFTLFLNLFFQELSKLIDPLSFDVVFRFDLHQIQMDVTQ
jgi:hypothetical protein